MNPLIHEWKREDVAQVIIASSQFSVEAGSKSIFVFSS